MVALPLSIKQQAYSPEAPEQSEKQTQRRRSSAANRTKLPQLSTNQRIKSLKVAVSGERSLSSIASDSRTYPASEPTASGAPPPLGLNGSKIGGPQIPMDAEANKGSPCAPHTVCPRSFSLPLGRGPCSHACRSPNEPRVRSLHRLRETLKTLLAN